MGGFSFAPAFLKKSIKKNRQVYRFAKDAEANWGLFIEKCHFYKCYITRFFNKPKMPDVLNVGYNLHLGSGPVTHPDLINVDGFPFKSVHYVRRIDDLSFCADNVVDLIYASHCLEHFKYSDVDRVLMEWFRTLKKDGILRISVPDFDKLLKIYVASAENMDSVIPQMMGGQENIFNFHYTLFNEKSLREKLLKCGFRVVREWKPGTDSLTTLNDFSIYQKEIDGTSFPVSLNLEGIK